MKIRDKWSAQGSFIRFKDGNKSNCDVSNLEWISYDNMIKHFFDTNWCVDWDCELTMKEKRFVVNNYQRFGIERGERGEVQQPQIVLKRSDNNAQIKIWRNEVFDEDSDGTKYHRCLAQGICECESCNKFVENAFKIRVEYYDQFLQTHLEDDKWEITYKAADN